MSASKYIKEQGLPNVKYVAGKAGINRQLLHDWYHNKFKLFEVVVAGVVHVDIANDLQELDDLIKKEKNNDRH